MNFIIYYISSIQSTFVMPRQPGATQNYPPSFPLSSKKLYYAIWGISKPNKHP